MDRALSRLIDLCCWPGRLAGWLVLPLIALVLAAVWAARAGLNAFADWEGEVFLLGGGVTVNTAVDLQWHLFALMVLFGGAYAFRDGRHVAVDVFASALRPRAGMVLRIAGDLLFLLPLCAVVVWYGVEFAARSHASGEASTYGGLTDRWVVKACVPAGFALLGLAGLARAARTALRLARAQVETPSGELPGPSA